MTKEGAEKRNSILTCLSTNIQPLLPFKTIEQIIKETGIEKMDLVIYLEAIEGEGYISPVTQGILANSMIPKDCWIISLKGKLFMAEEGGYVGRFNLQSSENRRLKATEARSMWLSFWVAFGTMGLLIWAVFSFGVDHHWWFCCHHSR